MMKKFIYCITICLITVCFNSCDLFELDNYDEPKETIKGQVVDVVTGKPVLTDQGSEGTRIRLRELSWTESKSPTNFDFWCMKEGNFQNNKVFAGHYNLRIDGAFIPLVRIDSKGDTLTDNSKYLDIKGVTEVKFEVQPFLNVEWVDEPTISNGQITAKFRVTRGVSKEEFKSQIQPLGNWDENYMNVNEVRLFVSQSPEVGYREWDNRYTKIDTYNDNSFEPQLGQVVTLTTIGNIQTGKRVYIRAAARLNYRTEGNYRHNYAEAKAVDVK